MEKGLILKSAHFCQNMIIQVQEGIRSNLQSVLHALTVVSGNVVLSSLITNCIHGGTLV